MAREPTVTVGGDPRCTCRMPACPICSAPAHQPWIPKAFEAQQAFDDADLDAAARNAMLSAYIADPWWRKFRRYLLVMLLALLGGMIGGVASALTILHYL